MKFLLADSFQSSLDKLNGEEQKAAKLAAFELQINPTNPGLQCHRLDNIKELLRAPGTGRIAVKVINHLGDEVMKVYKV